jgi:glycine cleavage system H lipoate-binding protein
MPTDNISKRKSGRPVIFNMTENQCIWSSAGIAKFRMCHNAFDCTSCTFDAAMQKKRAQGKIDQTWSEASKASQGYLNRKCRHMLSGYVPVKYCVNDFDCVTCEYDQLIDSELHSMRLIEPALEQAAGFSLAQNYYYHRGHSWARVEYSGLVRMGADDFAVRLMGPADQMELPKLGRVLKQGEAAVTFGRGSNRAEVLSPVHGAVVAVNTKLADMPSLPNEYPYGGGWMVMIKPNRLAKDLRNLLFGDEVSAWYESEAARLDDILQPQREYRLAATGPKALADIYGSVSGLNWDELRRDYLLNDTE